MLPGEESKHSRPGSSTTSLSLLIGLRSHQSDAWKRFVQVYGPLICNWCKRYGLQDSDRDDVVQEVFRVVHTRIEEFRKDCPEDTLRGWLWTITRHKLGDYWRRRQSQPQAQGGSAFRQQLEETPQQEASESEDMAGVYRRALEVIRGEFEDKTFQAFWLIVCESRRPGDVAEQLGLSLNAVYLAKSRVLRALRDLLGDAPG